METGADVRYNFPVPANHDDWQKAVTDAFEQQHLSWEHVVADQYAIVGKCPRCTHPFSNYKELIVVVPANGAGGVTRLTSAPTMRLLFFFKAHTGERSAEPLETDVVCTCSNNHGKKDAGCGWGRGLTVNVPWPQEVSDAGNA